eukprot:1988418-Rhodomonas_salina.1
MLCIGWALELEGGPCRYGAMLQADDDDEEGADKCYSAVLNACETHQHDADRADNPPHQHRHSGDPRADPCQAIDIQNVPRGSGENVGDETVSGRQGSVGEQKSAAAHHIDGYQRKFEAWDARVDQEDRERAKRYALGNLTAEGALTRVCGTTRAEALFLDAMREWRRWKGETRRGAGRTGAGAHVRLRAAEEEARERSRLIINYAVFLLEKREGRAKEAVQLLQRVVD